MKHHKPDQTINIIIHKHKIWPKTCNNWTVVPVKYTFNQDGALKITISDTSRFLKKNENCYTRLKRVFSYSHKLSCFLPFLRSPNKYKTLIKIPTHQNTHESMKKSHKQKPRKRKSSKNNKILKNLFLNLKQTKTTKSNP